MLARAKQAAHERSLELVVLTFHPHPSEVLGRGGLPVLTPIERKLTSKGDRGIVVFEREIANQRGEIVQSMVLSNMYLCRPKA